MLRIALFLFACCLSFYLQAQAPKIQYQHPIAFAPKQYVCYRSPTPLTIDGVMDEPAWVTAPWSTDFEDIEGANKPAPPLATRAKMLWDNRFLYIGATLSDPHLWATLKERDAVIFADDDFEVFIDPDGDGIYYAELEVNAFNTVWDLLMLAPYHLGQSPTYINNWNIRGLQTAVHLNGTLNQPADQDQGWVVEIAIPLDALAELTIGRQLPAAGDQWRINFSRVDWNMAVENQQYRKQINPATNKPFPESNWVWSPTGRIDMHRPETWGWIQFSGVESGKGVEVFKQTSKAGVQWALWQLFYAQRLYHQQHGQFAPILSLLEVPKAEWPGFVFQPSLERTANGFMIIANDAEGNTWRLTERGRMERVR